MRPPGDLPRSLRTDGPNGVYAYTVANVSGYAPHPSSGVVAVNGAAISIPITFTKTTQSRYAVTFSESGLPTGVNWSVTLNGTTNTSATATITFLEPNGSYSYTVNAPSRYTASPESGQITFLGFTGDTGYHLIGVIVAVIATAATVLLLHGSGKRPAPTCSAKQDRALAQDRFCERHIREWTLPYEKGDGKTISSEMPPIEYLSVSELNRSIKTLLRGEPDLQGIWVLGELSNLRPSPSGHVYPTLKDETSEIGCAIWARSLSLFSAKLKEGRKVLVHGSLDVYEPKGRYQLIIDDFRDFGIGELYARMEALKAKLKAEGLFDRKRPIPEFPRMVGLVTSERGAAVQDMIRILGRRFPLAHVILVPVQVQGPEAAQDIARGIEELNRLTHARPDVLIVGRGGGNIEDLWSFNEEVVARAIFASVIPVISGVGHETDFTIADFVADLRAATPSEAAEKAVPDKRSLLGQLDRSRLSLYQRMMDGIMDAQQILDEGALELQERMEKVLDFHSRELDMMAELLTSFNPRKVLERGYAVVTHEGEAVSSVASLHPGERVEIVLADGEAGAEIEEVRSS